MPEDTYAKRHFAIWSSSSRGLARIPALPRAGHPRISAYGTSATFVSAVNTSGMLPKAEIRLPVDASDATAQVAGKGEGCHANRRNNPVQLSIDQAPEVRREDP